jgi:hypothetical protein
MEEKKGNSRFGDIAGFEEVVESAALVKKEKPESEDKKKILLYGIPVKLAKAVDDSGESFSSFARRACIKLAKQEGLIY